MARFMLSSAAVLLFFGTLSLTSAASMPTEDEIKQSILDDAQAPAAAAPASAATSPADFPLKAPASQKDLLFPDISMWIHVDDWDALAKYSHGIVEMKVRQSSIDPLYHPDLAEAEKRGMIVIGYAFGYGGVDGAVQADAYLRNFPLHPGRIMMLDLERNPYGKTMTSGEAIAFVQRIFKRTGRYPLLYAGIYTPRPGVLAKCPRYTPEWGPRLTGAADIWQFTDGKVGPAPHTFPGIGACAINRLMVTYGTLRGLAGLPAAQARPAACDDIIQACEQAGFVLGQWKVGNGLWRDCIDAIEQGVTNPPGAKRGLPKIGSATVAACRQADPSFGQGKVGSTTTQAAAEALASR